MCLAIPAQVLTLNNETDMATVALGNIQKEVSISLVEDLSVGDFVLLHVGYALHKISPEEAERTLAMFEEAELLEELSETEESAE